MTIWSLRVAVDANVAGENPTTSPFFRFFPPASEVAVAPAPAPAPAPEATPERNSPPDFERADMYLPTAAAHTATKPTMMHTQTRDISWWTSPTALPTQTTHSSLPSCCVAISPFASSPSHGRLDGPPAWSKEVNSENRHTATEVRRHTLGRPGKSVAKRWCSHVPHLLLLLQHPSLFEWRYQLPQMGLGTPVEPSVTPGANRLASRRHP